MWRLKTTTVPVVMVPLAPSRRTWKTTQTNSLAKSTYMTSRKYLSFLKPTFSDGSSPSSRNALYLSKSMVWTRMLREKINCDYVSISYIMIINRPTKYCTTKIILLLFKLLCLSSVLSVCLARGFSFMSEWTNFHTQTRVQTDNIL